MRFRRAVASVLAVGVALSGRAAAASPQARLVYGRAEGADVCPDEGALRRAVAARIGYDPFFPASPRTVVVTIAARGDHFTAHVQLVDDEAHAQGARELESSGRDCASLFDTVALTVSIAIDPQALARPSAKLPPPAPPTPPAPAAPAPPVEKGVPLDDPPHEPPPPPPPTVRDPATVRLGAGLRSSIGLAPAPALGFAVSGGASWRHASLGAEAAIDLPATKHVSASESVSAWLFIGTLVPCLRFAPVALCGLASVGRLAGSADGVLSPQPRAALFLGFGARVGIELPLSDRLALEAHADALANTSPATLRVGTSDEWTALPVAGTLSVGAVASF